jgi:AraC-like DNA-binding protein
LIVEPRFSRSILQLWSSGIGHWTLHHEVSTVPTDSRPHILVVDDDPGIQESLTAALAGAYVVHATATGDGACELLRRHPVAAIILDEVLGREHGLDLVKRFRALSPAPILILTGYGSEDLAARALRARVNDYLKKPVSLRDLHEAMTRLLSHQGASVDPVVRARLFLDEHLATDFRADELAGQVGLSEAHLRRRFRAMYGKTPRRYLVEARLQRAVELLRSTRLGIEQIALAVGFADLPAFDRRFKRAYGVTPSVLRVREEPGERGRGRGGAV